MVWEILALLKDPTTVAQKKKTQINQNKTKKKLPKSQPTNQIDRKPPKKQTTKPIETHKKTHPATKPEEL